MKSKEVFNSELIEEIKQFTKKIGQKIFEGFKNEIIQDFKNRIKILKEISDGEVLNLLKIAMNYEEINKLNYNIDEVIRWFKENYQGDNYLCCLYKSTLKEDEVKLITLHHCFINKKDHTPVLDGSLPYRIVHTLNISEDLLKLFKDKDMIIIK